MQTKQYTTIDKSAWPRGPWDHEPDKIQWQDPATGLPCLIDRKDMGIFCGYVGVPESHPWYGKAYSEPMGECTEYCDEDGHCGHSIDSRLRAHGGVNFSDHCSPHATESSGVCHVTEPGESDRVWWFGFDAGHAGDVTPGYGHILPSLMMHGQYRDLAYVRAEVTQLAAQLAAVSASAA